MNVTGASGGSPITDPAAVAGGVTLPRLPSRQVPAALDQVSLSLPELTLPSIADLLQTVDRRLFAGGSEHVDSAGVSGHLQPQGVHSHLGQIPAKWPDGILLAARDSAEKSVAKAAIAIEAAGGRGPRVPGNPDARAVLALANQFIETGQIPNYLRAAELGREIALWFDGPLSVAIDTRTALAGSRRQHAQRQSLTMLNRMLGKLWRRAPVLALLLGWLLSGLAVAVFLRLLGTPAYESSLMFNIWAMGFLGLVVFQFLATIRGVLRPKSGGRLE